MKKCMAVAITLMVLPAPWAGASAQVGEDPQSSLGWEISNAGDIHQILPMRERARVYNEILEWRLDNILPAIMREEGVDMWVVINFEYDEDPVYMTLVPEPVMSARRLSILVFHDSDQGFKKLTANWHGTGSAGRMYENIFTDRSKGAW